MFRGLRKTSGGFRGFRGFRRFKLWGLGWWVDHL